jgi:hypothetical protein
LQFSFSFFALFFYDVVFKNIEVDEEKLDERSDFDTRFILYPVHLLDHGAPFLDSDLRHCAQVFAA